MPSRIAAIIAAAVILSGCAGGGPFAQRVTHQSVKVSYSPLQFSAFAAAGPLVEIRGAPPGGATPEQVVEALRLPARWPQTPFRLIAPGEAARSQRIVLVFGLPGGLGANLLCQGQVAPVMTEALTVGAAFCTGRRDATGAKLTDARPLGPDDSEFAVAMTRLFAELAPSRDPAWDDDDREMWMID
jgi:hypothetical protein